MAIKLKSAGTNIAPMESGVYMARVVRIVDMGIQPQEYQGEKKPSSQELQFTFEFPTELIEINGEKKPRWMSKTYKVSFHEKAGLVALLKAIDPDGSKIASGVEALLNSPCLVTVEQYQTAKKKLAAKVVGVTQVMRGTEVAELYTEPATFSLDEPDMDMWNTFPEWLQDSIRNAEDFADSPLASLDTPTTEGE